MAQAGFTPISLYFSSTASAVPSSGNLANGELGLNIADMKLYAKNSAGTVTLLASNAGASGSVTSVSGTGTVNGLTLTGTVTTSGSLTLGGTLSLVSPPAIGSTTPNSGAFTTLSATGNLTSLTAQFGTNPAGVSIGVIGIPNQKRIYGRNAANSADLSILFLDGNNSLVLGSADTTVIDSSGNVGIGTTSPAGKLQVGANDSSIILDNVYSAASPPTTGNNQYIFRDTNDGSLNFSSRPGGGGNYKFWNGATQLAIITNAGNVGIGTSSPQFGVDLRRGSGANAYFLAAGNNNGTTNGILFGQDTTGLSLIWQYGANPITFWTNSSERTRISSTGGFSVGTTSDPGVGAIYATGNITAFFSDKRLKTVSGKIENALDKVAKLSGVYYTFNDTAKSFGYDSDEEQVGVIAQEVEAVLPQIVKAAPFDLDENNNSKSGENYKTVQYDKLVPLLIEAINELQAKVKALEAK